MVLPPFFGLQWFWDTVHRRSIKHIHHKESSALLAGCPAVVQFDGIWLEPGKRSKRAFHFITEYLALVNLEEMQNLIVAIRAVWKNSKRGKQIHVKDQLERSRGYSLFLS